MEDFAAVWTTLAATDETLAARAPGETVRPPDVDPWLPTEVAPAREARRADTDALPRITLSEAAGPGAGDVALGHVLGEGGMGRVFAARQRSLGREIAVKTSRPGAPPAARAAILHEARTAGRLEHPNVVPVHALGLDAAGEPVMLMKRVEGCPWSALLRDPEHPAWERLPVRHADPLVSHLEILVQVCNALALAHDRGVLHRDVKPDNVMIGAFGEVYLLDWGIAIGFEELAAGEPGGLAGTPAYLAPEMLAGDLGALGPHTDVYLLGATLHEVLVGAPRHAGADVRAVLASALASAPFAYPAHVPADLAALCNAATAREPRERPADVTAFRARLAAHLAHAGSARLARTATEALGGVRERVAAEGEAALRSDEAFTRLAEARFACLEALRGWSENAEARASLRGALGLLCERELLLGSASAARALAAQLSPRDEALDRRIDEALRAEETRRRHAEGLEALRRDMDAAPANRVRAIVFAGFLVMSIGVTGVVGYRAGRGLVPSVRDLLGADVLGIGALGGAGLVLRRRLLTNTINRRLTWALAAQVAYLTVADVIAALAGLSMVAATTTRLLVLSGSFAVGAVLWLPAMRWLAALTGAGALAAALVPEAHAGWLGGGTMLGVLGAAAWLVGTDRLRPRASDLAG